MESSTSTVDVEAIAEAVAKSQPESVREACKVFVRLFFNHFPAEDFIDRPSSDISGCLLWLWSLLQGEVANLPIVQVVNPELDSWGWSSPHTVIAVRQMDMPFLVDSIRLELAHRHIPIFSVKSTPYVPVRQGGQLVEILPVQSRQHTAEAMVYLEVGKLTDARSIREAVLALNEVLGQIQKVVTDFLPLKQAMLDSADELGQVSHALACNDVTEAQKFLHWLTNDHFTFLGFTEFNLENRQGKDVLVEDRHQRVGLFDDNSKTKIKILDDAHPGVSRFYLSPASIAFSKSPRRSRIHRSAYPDYVVVKRYNPEGKVIGECRFLGLYTSSVYSESPSAIPLLREKISYLYERMGLTPWSHEGKALEQIVETFPRDELFQSSAAELYETVRGILEINERYKVKLFLRRDRFAKFVSCLLYVPRDLFSTQIRLRVQQLIGEKVGACDEQFNTFFSESLLARVHLVFRLKDKQMPEVDTLALEQEIEAMVRSWQDALLSELYHHHTEEQARYLAKLYDTNFSAAYQEAFTVQHAASDIAILESMEQETLWLEVIPGSESSGIRLKLYRQGMPLALSDIIPLLEDFGLRVLSEHPFKLLNKNKKVIWLHDFELQRAESAEPLTNAGFANLKQAIIAVWEKKSESDSFNQLVVEAGLDWRMISVFRAYANYMQQTLFNSSIEHIAEALVNQRFIVMCLVKLFNALFSPENNNSKLAEEQLQAIDDALENVPSLIEDRIIRQYVALMNATVRTNYFQSDTLDYLAFKLMPRQLNNIPEPKPMFEIFVYSGRFEGLHLRGGKVARGGLRWSDRYQDYRTEVLGLVKAQQVKNAVIVPSGAKGGFVCKQVAGLSREEKFAEGKACYRQFIQALLSISDNVIDDQVVLPNQVVCKDEPDPYLVVAADKGTATFSDLANSVAQEADFWLGDAFASGGSQGYDHKAMGITAKGAWVCVQRHFKELSVDVQNDPITVVGIGDMGGDVFGNGMLCSESIQLVAAFNHLHIFIDPQPDASASFAERQRLFNAAGSQWSDYDESLISAGGGVFDRSAKSISLTAEARSALGIDASRLTPAELINHILRAPVDLIWNGGIGTYVKAEAESHAEVGDKANDAVRINGNDLRCKVFGEGGNLGMTQLGRIEFALAGGACNTDFIDNSAGVDCSDHEVNIKISLSQLIKADELGEASRNALLVEMTDEVSSDVLLNNYRQSQAISLASGDSLARTAEIVRFIHCLEAAGRLDRALEFLPDDEKIAQRQAAGKGLVRPEISVLISYAKVGLKEDLATPTITQDPVLAKLCLQAFPATMQSRFPKVLMDHPLVSEIVATQLANDIVNTQGFTFVQRMIDATGSTTAEVARAYFLATTVAGVKALWRAIEDLGFSVEDSVQQQLLQQLMRRVRRMTRWFLRNRRGNLDLTCELQNFSDGLVGVQQSLVNHLGGEVVRDWQDNIDILVSQGVPESLCQKVLSPGYLYSGMGILDVADQSKQPVEKIVEIYAGLVACLHLNGFAQLLSDARVENDWQAMAREAYMDDLESQVRNITQSLAGIDQSPQVIVEQWAQSHQSLLDRWLSMVKQTQTAGMTDYAMFSVALRELLDLAQVTRHS
ncbi:NAD-glutamate dehydrogenase [Gilvimarinus sp. 1_MG-2023]|uniref:NAD-glutamate dehydrogenase n=1 Tax=Gilvimarinus sp. 1_MG-2023 TaxID=3062638 RepID=UPI0026E45208|nr:NAD-glutamate dehydrogenase [Gilvimarinus sp. 1_MG-2023]MDO6745733.1 NAD-glutamate dehydrogenase [Gilvimarinus sp. 1_MG-2023]